MYIHNLEPRVRLNYQIAAGCCAAAGFVGIVCLSAGGVSQTPGLQIFGGIAFGLGFIGTLIISISLWGRYGMRFGVLLPVYSGNDYFYPGPVQQAPYQPPYPNHNQAPTQQPQFGENNPQNYQVSIQNQQAMFVQPQSFSNAQVQVYSRPELPTVNETTPAEEAASAPPSYEFGVDVKSASEYRF